MSDQVYKKLAKVLDTLPNGFPASEDGLEIKILKLIFSPEDADLFCDLRLTFETPEQIAQRTGRPLEGLAEHLFEMMEKGQIFGIDFGTVWTYRLAPWVLGIFEYQLHHLTTEKAKFFKAYQDLFSEQFFTSEVPLMNIIPVEEEVNSNEASLPFEQVSAIIDNGKSFGIHDCICKKEHELLGAPCDRPTAVCMAIAPVENVFKGDGVFKSQPITKQEARDLLKQCEENGLVHMTSNIEHGHFFICNCCGCCCGVLDAVKKYGARAVNSYYYAAIDPDACAACGVCADERCQVDAIEEVDDAYRIIEDQCIGCGLCVRTCPSEAISLHRKAKEEIVLPPVNEKDWFEKRAAVRGVDYNQWA